MKFIILAQIYNNDDFIKIVINKEITLINEKKNYY